jgi:hypothetical protein
LRRFASASNASSDFAQRASPDSADGPQGKAIFAYVGNVSAYEEKPGRYAEMISAPAGMIIAYAEELT